MREELSPCPFCGNKSLVMLCERLDKRYTVHCGNCGNGTVHWINKQDAIAAWNRRAGMTITRGPWEWGSGENDLVIRPQGIPEDNEAFVIAVLPMESYEHLEDWSESGWSAEGEANARLIAAAPEMLELLKEARNEFLEADYDAPVVDSIEDLLFHIGGEGELEDE